MNNGEVTDVVARVGLAISLVALVLVIAAFLFLWIKVRTLEKRIHELMGESPMEGGFIFPRRQNKGHKNVTLMNMGRMSGYESASESVILEDNVVVASGQRRASLHGKTKFIYQVYRTAQCYFSNKLTQTDTKLEPSVEDIAIETFNDNRLEPITVNAARYSHKSGKEQEKPACRKQMLVTKTIDSSGGQLEISGVMLTIPTGALKDSINISLGLSWDETKRPSLMNKQALLSPVIVCQPHNLEFSKPVQLSFPHCAVNALTDWTICLLKNDSEIGGTEWNGLTLEDYEERDVTDSIVSLHLSRLYPMYCCTGESKTGKTASKSMSLIAYSSVQDEENINGLVLKAFCVNDYSKCTVNSGLSDGISRDTIVPTFLAVHGDGHDVLVATNGTQPCNQSNGLDLTQKRLSFIDVWHDCGPNSEFVVMGEPCELMLYQESHESVVHHLSIRPLSLTNVT